MARLVRDRRRRLVLRHRRKASRLAPASFSVVLISALGDRQNTFKDAVILALAIVVVCILLFSLALKVEFPIFSWQ